MDELARFCIEYSAHGFGYILDRQEVSRAEGIRRIEEWRRRADTVGGDARFTPQKGDDV